MSVQQVTSSQAAQRMSELLQQFPCAASSGVSWIVLNQVYEQRYGAPLNIQTYGHSTAFDACMALLWEVSRTVSRSNADNPVLGVDDEIALTPEANNLASWPSLYATLSTVAERKDEGVALSALPAILQHQWHRGFAEGKMSFFNEEGVSEKITSLQQLVLLVIHWREQWQQWRQTETRRTRLEGALALDLELVPGTGDELVLRVLRSGQAPDANRLRFVPKSCKVQMWSENAGKVTFSKVKGLADNGPVGSVHCAAIPTGIVQRCKSQIQSAR